MHAMTCCITHNNNNNNNRPTRFRLQPIAVETLGRPINESSVDFLRELGHKDLLQVSGGATYCLSVSEVASHSAAI